MDTLPIDTGGMLSRVAEQGALFAFMMLCIIGLCLVIKVLYNRNIKQGDDQQKALIDSTVAINNNTLAVNALTKQIERMADVR
jgi:putative Mn2+ efflux pump MntP